MAVYFLRSKHISRGNGSRVTRAAAYRAGERIADERTSEVYDHTDRRDVAHKEIVLPADLTGQPDMAWTQDRAILWNAAEFSGLRRNSRLAREWLVLLPPELTPERRVALVRSFASDLADRYRCAVDVCIHEPRPTADPRNHHAHLLMTTREVTPAGFGHRTNLELGGRERMNLGVGESSREQYLALREGWARRVNQALQNAGLSARIDHRSYQRQGIDRDPVPDIPEKVLYAERKTQHQTDAGEAIRARHRERAAARSEGPAALAEVRARQDAELKERAWEEFKRRDAGPRRTHWGSLTRQERNVLRREQYRERRALEKLDAAGEAKRREQKRQAYHAQMRKNPDGIRAARARWREAHRQEMNRNQREYRAKNADALNEKRRTARRARAGLERGPPHANRLGPAPEQRSVPPAEQQSAWKAYRERHGPGPTPEESARNWRILRDSGKFAEASPSTHAHRIGPDVGASHAGEEAARDPVKNHDQDLGL